MISMQQLPGSESLGKDDGGEFQSAVSGSLPWIIRECFTYSKFQLTHRWTMLLNSLYIHFMQTFCIIPWPYCCLVVNLKSRCIAVALFSERYVLMRVEEVRLLLIGHYIQMSKNRSLGTGSKPNKKVCILEHAGNRKAETRFRHTYIDSFGFESNSSWMGFIHVDFGNVVILVYLVTT